jgi:hypothetical protein
VKALLGVAPVSGHGPHYRKMGRGTVARNMLCY